MIKLVWDKLSDEQKALSKKVLAAAILVLGTALAALQVVNTQVQ
jgi:hypothetical protein